MKNKRTRQAVTPIVGTVLLLGMAISMFAVLNLIVFSYPQEPKSPAVNLVGAINNSNIIVNHYGGESLDNATQIIVTVDSGHYMKNFQDYLIDTNGDYKFSFGEVLVIDDMTISSDQHVAISLVDIKSNSIILTAVLQKGGS